MIPKIIHYCWFGGKEKPQSVCRYIQTWKAVMPDYEIREWNETNIDLKNIPFAQEAYIKGKYAFVSDVVRLQVLYNYGGIYMDTDVEVIKCVDEFLDSPAFVSFEGESSISTAVIGAQPSSEFIKDCLSYYEGRHFIQSDDAIDTTPNTRIIANFLRGKGLLFDNTRQKLGDNYLIVYPVTYFSAKQFPSGKLLVTENTYCIHNFAGSWLSGWGKLKLFLHRILGI